MPGMDETYVSKSHGDGGYIEQLNTQLGRLQNLEAMTAESIREIELSAEDELNKKRVENVTALFKLRRQLAVNQKALDLNFDDQVAAHREDIERRTQERLNDYVGKRLEEIQKKEERLAQDILKKKTKGRRDYTADELKDALAEAKRLTQIERDNLKDTEKLKEKIRKRELLESEKAAKEEAETKRKLFEQNAKEQFETLTKQGATFTQRKDALKSMFTNEDGDRDIGKGIGTLVNGLSNAAAKLDSTASNISKLQSGIDTRLHGSKGKTDYLGSYYRAISTDYNTGLGMNPYFKQEELYGNLTAMVERGIAHNVEQRAFLATIKDKIATTFNATDGTLLRLVRIQQQDTTANRLGMEAALNAFLNNMYETTEYLSDVAASVRSSLEEMESLMSGAQATEIEYQVQKWMGSMYSVGMSQSSVQSLADAIGKIGAGDISGITNGGTGNLVVMAANEAGISIADILAEGLDSDQTNKLMQSMVNYLAEIANSSSDSNVVQQQLASVYGLRASDLRAAKGLADKSTITSITNNTLTYNNMLNELTSMVSTLNQRTSIGEMMTNAWDNANYSMASNLANSPISFFTYKAASMLKDLTGGISIPAISVMGNMVDLHTTVADLMRVGAMAVPALKSLGGAVTGIASAISPTTMLSAMGIGSGDARVKRGSGGGVVARATHGSSTSTSGLVGNGSSEDLLNATMAGADDEKNEKMVSALESEDADTPNRVIDEHLIDIYKLLLEVTSGDKTFTVQMKGGNTAIGNTGFEDTPWGQSGNTRSFTIA